MSTIQKEIIAKMQAGWMLHCNGFLRPPTTQPELKLEMVKLATVKALERKGLIEFTFRSDYWTLKEYHDT